MTKRNVDIHINGRERTGKAFRKARQDFKRLGSELGRLTKRAAAFSAVAAGAAVAGLSLVVKHNLEAIDATGKLSDRLKVSTEDLLAWRHAAELAGVSGQNLDKAVEEMNKRLGEVRETGTGEALKGMDMLGLSMRDIRDFGPAELFETIADRIAAIEDPAKRSAAAYAFFGRQGKQLINLLAGGSSGLRQARAELESMGALYSREEARQVEAANDAMTRLQTTFAGLAQTLTIELAPTLEAVAQTLKELIADNSDIGTVLSNAFHRTGDAIVYVLGAVEALLYGFNELRIFATKYSWMFGMSGYAVGSLGREEGESKTDFVARLEAEQQKRLSGLGLDERLRKILDKVRSRNSRGTGEAADPMVDFASQMGMAYRALMQLNQAADDTATTIYDRLASPELADWAAKITDSLAGPEEKLQDIQARLVDAMGLGYIGLNDATAYLAGQRQKLLGGPEAAPSIAVAPSTFSARSARGLTDVPGGQNPMVLAARAAEKTAATAADQLAVQEDIRRELVRQWRDRFQPANLN